MDRETPPASPSTVPALPDRLSVGGVVFLNLVLIGVLAFLISRGPIPLGACRFSEIAALSWGVILVMLGQLVWRTLRPATVALAGAVKLAAAEIPLKALIALFDAVHLSLLSNRALALLAACVVGVAGVFGLSPLSPFRVQEIAPIIRAFTAQFLDGSTQSYPPGDELKIQPGEQVLIEAPALSQADSLCTWSAVYGNIVSAEGCATLYRLPRGRERDTLALLAQSPCSTRQTFAGLSIAVIQP